MPHATFVAPAVPMEGATLTFRLVVNDGQMESEHAEVNVTVKNVNHPPVAEAGPDQTVQQRTAVTLMGSASYDPDGDPITYRWVQVAGTPVELSSSEIPSPSFLAPFVNQPREVLRFGLRSAMALKARWTPSV
jgi:chitinase